MLPQHGTARSERRQQILRGSWCAHSSMQSRSEKSSSELSYLVHSLSPHIFHACVCVLVLELYSNEWLYVFTSSFQSQSDLYTFLPLHHSCFFFLPSVFPSLLFPSSPSHLPFFSVWHTSNFLPVIPLTPHTFTLHPFHSLVAVSARPCAGCSRSLWRCRRGSRLSTHTRPQGTTCVLPIRYDTALHCTGDVYLQLAHSWTHWRVPKSGWMRSQLLRAVAAYDRQAWCFNAQSYSRQHRRERRTNPSAVDCYLRYSLKSVLSVILSYLIFSSNRALPCLHYELFEVL